VYFKGLLFSRRSGHLQLGRMYQLGLFDSVCAMYVYILFKHHRELLGIIVGPIILRLFAFPHSVGPVTAERRIGERLCCVQLWITFDE